MGGKLGLSHQRKEYILVVSEKRVLRTIFIPKSEEVQEAGKNCLMRVS
jgi:hypothetical protein